MIHPRIRISLDDRSASYLPGDELAGQYWLEGLPAEEIRCLEFSVLWHTEGKGEEDMSVHFFERVDPAEDRSVDLRQPQRFSTVLPNSPLTYSGLIVKICWCVRVRAFLTRQRELSLEVPFRLGAVPQPQAVSP
jgi:hypothetical protein